MKRYERIDLLGRAFAYGEIDAFIKCMNTNCKYHSDYARKHLNSADQIAETMKSVNAAVRKSIENGEDCSYDYTVIPLLDIFNDGVSFRDLRQGSISEVGEHGLLLYQYHDENPVAVVFAHFNPGDQITEITLSRNKKWFSVQFYGDDGLEDSDKDVPYTVKPMTRHDGLVKRLQTSFTYQKHAEEDLKDENIYIWRQADKYVKSWLENKGYNIFESAVFKDCIGYRCSRNGRDYTVYMFAYGKTATVWLDGDYCSRFLDQEFSKDSTVLIVYLNVKREKFGDQYQYTVCNYSGDEDLDPQLWRLIKVEGKPILEYYTYEEMMDLSRKLMYAFNHDDLDVYERIIQHHNPSVIGPGDSGYYMNNAVYSHLKRLHEQYGNMKLGYVRYNDVIYSAAPYLDGYGYFDYSVENETNRISSITGFAFDDEERKVAEFIKTEDSPDDGLYDSVPKPVSVSALDPVSTERFALKVVYDNGECRKFVLPIDREQEHDEVVKYRAHVFTDIIWKSVEICDQQPVPASSISYRWPGVKFKNGYRISSLTCYEEGTPYSEPEELNEVVYEDTEHRITALWKWNVKSIWEDEETGLLKVLLYGQAFNWYGKSTFASIEGKRICSLDFDDLDSFHNGLSRVCIAGEGYGFIDPDMNFVVPLEYERADNFEKGKAKVKLDGVWYSVDTSGRLIKLSSEQGVRYQDIGRYSEGLCKVSTLKLGFMDLAYHSDYSEIAGTWGYIDEEGNEVIHPQYIYAYDFQNRMAIVCKGKWTIDEKWDNEHNQGRYWTDEELWGAIDPSGNEVIPFIFDEIKFFHDTEDVFMAHYGGWEEGLWGVIDKHGNWLVEPVFKDIDYQYHDGLFAFYADDSWSDFYVPLGVYDIKQKQVIFEPQFLDVDFLEDGYLQVEVFDEALGRKIDKIIDRNGNERFHSEYSSIHSWKEPYEVVISDENGDRHGLIDKDGTVVLPCKYDVPWGGIHYEQKRIIFQRDGKQGVMDFVDKILIEPAYLEIYGMEDPLLKVRVGDKENYKEGLITPDGKDVLPKRFEWIRWGRNNRIICCSEGECEVVVYQYEKK